MPAKKKPFCANTAGRKKDEEWGLIIRAACDEVGAIPPVKEYLVLEGVLPPKGKVDGFPDYWFTPKQGNRRKFRFDYAWPEYRLAVEVDGVSPVGFRNRHQDIGGFTADCVKHNIANMLGWRLLRYTQALLYQGYFLQDMRQLAREGLFNL